MFLSRCRSLDNRDVLIASADNVGEISWCSLCRPLFLRVFRPTVLVELRLNRFLKLFAVRSMACTLRPEDDARTRATSGLYRNVAEPFRYAYHRLFYLRLARFERPASGFPMLGSFS
jgi:hypothetical protein